VIERLDYTDFRLEECMKRKVLFLLLFCFLSLVCVQRGYGQEPGVPKSPYSKETSECLDCHRSVTPGIVEDWLRSRHSFTVPGNVVKRPQLERRMSGREIPETLLSQTVGCYECHSLNPSLHRDNFDHFGYSLNIVVSPNDCGICHTEEVEQYGESKKAYGLDILRRNPIFDLLTETITSVKKFEEGKISALSSSECIRGGTCYGCHGTEVSVKGTKEIITDFGEVEVPVLTNWPNQGVGRINPDGSRGACTSCHPRHSFSIEIARKPYTCAQCHLEPDVPAYNVYKESKHGNIFESKKQLWRWDQVPWIVGKDFQTPTCASCHNSLLATTEGEVVAQRTHDFGSRLWVRLFGVLYSHPQPKSGKTFEIKNSDGLPFPTTYTGELATEYLLDKKEQRERKEIMEKVCRSCHSSSWTHNHFEKLDSANSEVDQMVLASTLLLLEAWDKGIEDKTNPFDESLELQWIEQWLFFANSVRYVYAMGGPDYASFKNGWWNLSKNLQEMKDALIGKDRESE
jgi:hydroxylamine dehydrogenase